MEVLESGPGAARVALTVERRHLNLLGRTHGAVYFAVADQAFALAVNSLAPAVALEVNLNFLRPTGEGDRLTGSARVRHRGRCILVVDLAVEDGSGRLLANGAAIAVPPAAD